MAYIKGISIVEDPCIGDHLRIITEGGVEVEITLGSYTTRRTPFGVILTAQQGDEYLIPTETWEEIKARLNS